MDFEPVAMNAVGAFAISRDLLYLAILFLGAGIGFIILFHRKKVSVRFRNASLTTGFCFFSGTVAALTGAIIFSNGRILLEDGLYIPLACVLLIMILIICFPRFVGFPVFIMLGIFVVCIGFTFLRFPLIDGSACYVISREGNEQVRIQPAPPGVSSKNIPLGSGRNRADLLIRSINNDTVLEFLAFYVVFPKNVPLIGGESRGFITEIRKNLAETIVSGGIAGSTIGSFRNRELLYEDHSIKESLIRIWKRFYFFREVLGILEIKNLRSGTGIDVCLDFTGLAFR